MAIDAAEPEDLHPRMANVSNDSNGYGIDILNSAWVDQNDGHQAWMHVQHSQHGWSLSTLSQPDSTSALTSPSQALAEWPVLTDAASSRPSAPGAAESVDRLLPLGNAGPSPDGRSTRTTGGHLARDVDRTANTTMLPSTVSPAAEHGGTPEISTTDSDKDDSLFSMTSVGRSRSEATSRYPTTPASPGREHSHSNQTLHTLTRQDLAKTRDLVEIFFSEIHPFWPILHVPTFELDTASDLLLGAMLMLSSWVMGRQDHSEIAPTVLEEVMAATELVCVAFLHSFAADS